MWGNMSKKKMVLFSVIFIVVIMALSLIITSLSSGMKGKVAVVNVTGPIVEAKTVVDEIKGYAKDSSVKAIVLRVDSPGGGVAASQEIYEQVKRTVEKKKVIVSMGSVAASGGYYIAAPADLIMANPGTITGSIGVIMVVPNLKGLLDKVGVKTDVVKSGRLKDLASVFRGIGPEERQVIQGVMNDVHDQFIRAVADGRRMEVKTVRSLSDGRIFSGSQALKLGLVDELGDMETAIKKAAQLAGIEGEPTVVTKAPKGALSRLLDGEAPEGIMRALPDFSMKYMYYMYMP
jgi:protease IV